jgi:hypothetical protein
MVKIILFIYICSTTLGNECKLIYTDTNQFNDMYDCTVSGYEQSKNLISGLSREFVNEHGAHVKFICRETPII